jgi:formamidopyrimidine-DNA glycosylase
MGPEPLDDDFDAEALACELQRHKVMIKAALLDQRRVAGLGNIYADEVCFEAGVHPAVRASDLSLDQLRRIVACMRPILERAIAARGATLKDGGYQDLFGQFGEFIPKAYGNTGSPCVTCGIAIEHGKLGHGKGARSYHFCPACQPIGAVSRSATAEEPAPRPTPLPKAHTYLEVGAARLLRRVAERG